MLMSSYCNVVPVLALRFDAANAVKKANKEITQVIDSEEADKLTIVHQKYMEIVSKKSFGYFLRFFLLPSTDTLCLSLTARTLFR